MKITRKVVISAVVIGVLLCIVGAALVYCGPKVFNKFIDEQLVLSETSGTYQSWEATPVPIYLEIYFFNWTNHEEFEKDPSIKPALQEVGPYTFREEKKKIVVNWFEKNSTVTYLQKTTWHFEPEMTTGKLTDVIYTVNTPALTAAHALRFGNKKVQRLALNVVLMTIRSKIWVGKTVNEFLFHGYSDPLLDLAGLIPNQNMPKTHPVDRFGWFYKRNGSTTDKGVFNTYTGADDISKLGEIGEWNYAKHTSFYEGHCGNVTGSAGDLFTPRQQKDSLTIFAPDMCRTMTLNYDRQIVMDGIRAYRFVMDSTMFDNAIKKSENWCYCPSGGCPPNGLLDISTCKFGAPVFLSFPHFLYADDYVRDAVDGLQPNESLHTNFMHIEPNAGIPIEVQIGLQLNILIQPVPDFRFLSGVPKMYFPALWFKNRVKIPEELAMPVRAVSLIPIIGASISYTILFLGILLLVVILICHLKAKKKDGYCSVRTGDDSTDKKIHPSIPLENKEPI